MSGGRVLVTTGWLRPGDAVDRQLCGAGFDVVHSSSADRADTGETLVDVVSSTRARWLARPWTPRNRNRYPPTAACEVWTT